MNTDYVDIDIEKYIEEQENNEIFVEEIPQWLADDIASPKLVIPGITC